MKIIDPLKLKILDLAFSGNPKPFSSSRNNYGTHKDIEDLLSNVNAVYHSRENLELGFVLIDFTPFTRITIMSDAIKMLFDGLRKLTKPRPVLMFFDSAPLSQLITILKELGENEPPIPILVFDQYGSYFKLICNPNENEYVRKNLMSWIEDRKTEANNTSKDRNPNVLLSIRKAIANVNLLELILECDCVEIPSLSSRNISGRYGRLFKKMPNGMLVSSYIDLKRLGGKIENMMTLAYEALVFLADGFRISNKEVFEFDAIVVPNHTSLFLCSILQSIIQLPIVALDRIGPVPSIKLRGAHKHSDYLQGKRTVIIEEVIATGNEVDRTLLYLAGIGVKVVKVITFFNLKVGRPYLIEEKDIISLCLPKDELKYVYRSE